MPAGGGFEKMQRYQLEKTRPSPLRHLFGMVKRLLT
jgi:hypothetical protein